MVLALRRLMLAIAIVSGLGIAGMSLAAPHALATSTAYVSADDGADDDGDDDDDDRPRGGVETGQGGTAAVEGDATWSIDQQPVSAQSADGSDVMTVVLALGGISLLLGGAYLASRKLGGS
ncbi:hypothetical protein [Nonomuraea ceibae]|uniref:hypothetical protein n=1 Tax=Nonomuraea ceibae TaxID=1935170 RepID=UPI001C5F403D|nr:hypothetical protein [Nonomuraea ceibae]